MSNEHIKKHLKNILLDTVEERINSLQNEVDAAIHSRDTAAKSTAGDKHETGRAMMQTEIDNLQAQLSKNVALKEDVLKIAEGRQFEFVDFGALVITNDHKYFITVGLGSLSHEGDTYYAISMASPIGQLLKNKKVGELAHFNGREIKITSII
jgi:hypothetical protein